MRAEGWCIGPAGYPVGIFRAGGHTGVMGRVVTAVVTHGCACAGMVGPFHVDSPWWAEVEPVVTHLEETLGVPAVVLRLLTVEGSDGARDGHVTYHAEADRKSTRLNSSHAITSRMPSSA